MTGEDLTTTTDNTNNETVRTMDGDSTDESSPVESKPQTRFNFYTPQESIPQVTFTSSTSTKQEEPRKETLRFNFYNAEEVQAAAAPCWNLPQQHKRTSSQPTALVTPAAPPVRSPSASHSHPPEVDSKEILKSLQETERARIVPLRAAAAARSLLPRSSTSSSQPNPYKDAIQEALLMLQRNKQTTTTTSSSVSLQPTEDDLVMQLRREERSCRTAEDESHVYTSLQKSSLEWTPPLPGMAQNNTAEELIRLRSESDDHTAATEQHRHHHHGGDEADESVDTATSTVVSNSVEQVLLAILERANSATQTRDINHATELDALSAAMENLLQPTCSFETISTTRSRRPNRREIEQHALDVPSLLGGEHELSSPEQSVVNEFLAAMDSSSADEDAANTSSIVEELLQDQVVSHKEEKLMKSPQALSDYGTPVSSTEELNLDESIEVVESTTTEHDQQETSSESESESHSGSSSTLYDESTETEEYEEEDYRETSLDEKSTLTHLLGKLRTQDDDDDEDANESVLTNVLGPLSRRAGGTTGVVLEASSEEVQPQQPPAVADDTASPLSPASIYETLSSAVRDAESFMSFVTSGGYPNVKDRYFAGDDDDENAVPGRGGGDFDADAHELMRSLCAHLLPYGVDKSTGTPKLERIPVWDESNPDEAGYRIIRLSKRQLYAVESEFDKMVKSVKRSSELDLNGSLNKADTKNDWNGIPDDDFTRDLEEAEELLDQEEKRREEADRAIARTEPESDDESESASSRSGSRSSNVSGTMEGMTSAILSETDDDTMLTSHPDFPGVKTPGKGEIGDLEFFHLPIIYKSNVTGFEPTKDLYLEPGNVVAGLYLVENELGSAAFSTAYRCVDLSSETTNEKGKQVQQEVCLKVIKNTKDFFDQSLDEIKILELLRQTGKCHEKNILEMKTFFYHREHLIIVTELLRQNLFEFGKFITDSDEEPYFTRPRLCYITRQVLIALDFVHNMGLVHSDVKPENILLSSYSRVQVKLIDFGSSCYLTDRQSSYIQSRSYRAPEVVLGLPYNGKIDMWSLGCVVAEMYSGDVTFQNDSIVSMLSRIEAICGPFPRHMIAQGRQSNRFFTKSGLLFEHVDSESGDGPSMERLSDNSLLDVFQPKRTTLAARLGIPDIETEDEAHFVDFCSKLLAVDPDSRPTAAEALKHPWIVAGQSITEEDIKYPSK